MGEEGRSSGGSSGVSEISRRLRQWRLSCMWDHRVGLAFQQNNQARLGGTLSVEKARLVRVNLLRAKSGVSGRHYTMY